MTQNEKLFLGIGATLLAVYLYNRSKKNSVPVTAQPIDALTNTTSSGTIPATMGSGTITSAMVAPLKAELALAPALSSTGGNIPVPTFSNRVIDEGKNPNRMYEPVKNRPDYQAIKKREQLIKDAFLTKYGKDATPQIGDTVITKDGKEYTFRKPIGRIDFKPNKPSIYSAAKIPYIDLPANWY